ncbi:MAG TPA: DUF192 domain-containing protein [Candidatus Bathyarchaeia archaeon]|nr:DUF192 domain-containing protein [Candidatus Bathyarchaeia archaeon]
MNKLVVGSLLVFLALAAAVVYSVNQHKTTHIIISGTVLTVELAETPSAQEKGLSDRPSLPDDHGMLFVFDQQDYWGFWMIDMRFHLDIIWFDSNRQVVFIEPNLSPCTPQNCPVFTPNAKALYVLEVNTGFVAAHQVTYGTSFVFLGL